MSSEDFRLDSAKPVCRLDLMSSEQAWWQAITYSVFQQEIRGLTCGVNPVPSTHFTPLAWCVQRPRPPMAAFLTLFGSGTSLPPTTYKETKESAFATTELTG